MLVHSLLDRFPFFLPYGASPIAEELVGDGSGVQSELILPTLSWSFSWLAAVFFCLKGTGLHHKRKKNEDPL